MPQERTDLLSYMTLKARLLRAFGEGYPAE